MSHAFRGRQLELALARAGRDYRKAGRAIVVRQHPQTGTGPDGGLRYVSGAPVDFLGAHAGGRGLVMEAKETSRAEGFQLADLEDDQRAALALFEGMGAAVWVVIDFCREAEVYRVPWAAIVEFLAAPWRKSLSIDWCRAHGRMLPEVGRGTDERRTLFLDDALYPGWAGAVARVQAERCAAPVITLEDELAAAERHDQRKGKKQQAMAARLAARPDPRDKDAYAAYMRGLVGEGIDRQLGAGKRKWGRRRG